MCALLVTAACAGLTPGSGPPPGPAPAPGQVFAPPHPAPLSANDLSQRLAAARVVVVGETHDHPGHHAIELRILTALADLPGPLAVGVEWLEEGDRAAADRLSAGQISVEEFARQVNWPDKWGFSLELYRPIFQFIQDRRLTLVPLNAPRPLVHQVARQGLASLSPAERGQLAPSLDLSPGGYRDFVLAQAREHGLAGGPALDNFFAAQVVRDETMAHNLAQELHPWPDGGKRAVVFCGSGHMAHAQGLVPRVARRLPGPGLLTVLPVTPGEASVRAQGQGPPADLLIVSTPAPPRPPRLGVIIKPASGGLRVERVFPGSAAQKAGIQAGDVLQSIDGRPLSRAKDIHDAIKEQPRRPHRFVIRRDGQTIEMDIGLGPAPPGKAPKGSGDN
ncbi:MAG: ChaN family lipoprotein [Deltaproteobacteria bacterium]|nr:ChaN family lipoprotein [Deltaproteobacteria bacterium]